MRAERAHDQRVRAQEAAAVVGVDAGKLTHALAVRPRGQKDTKPFAFGATRAGFERAGAFIEEATGGADHGHVIVGIEFAGVYGFTLAHFLHQQGFSVVSVLAAHTKKWKEVVHGGPVKSDPKDALNITDLAAQGRFVTFPFLEPVYAELRYLVSARQRLVRMTNGTRNRMKSTLQVIFPEFEEVFSDFTKKTPIALLEKYPTPHDLLRAPKRSVIKLLREVSRGQCGEGTYEQPMARARATVALTNGQSVLATELRLLIERLHLFQQQEEELLEAMTKTLLHAPAGPHLLTIPKMGPATAAAFLGLIGDPKAYASSRQVLMMAGLNLVPNSSGTRVGTVRLSRRGKPQLRKLVYMFAMRHVRASDGIYRAQFERMVHVQKRPKKQAVVQLMRPALRMMFAVAREERDYAPDVPLER